MTAAMKAAQRPESAFSGPPRPPRVPKVLEGQKNELVAALAAGQRPVNPAQDKIDATRNKTLSVWAEVEKRLVAQGDTELAKDVAALMREGEKPVRSRAQELYDLAQSQSRNQVRDDGHGL